MIIAVDGPAASGKGTLARKIAAFYNLPYLDTGLLYRAVGHKLLANGQDPDDAELAKQAAETLDISSLTNPALREEAVGEAASKVAKNPSVRQALLVAQQAFANQKGGAVLDGRDIGTVICPHADVKLFIIADVTARAERRFKEISASNPDIRLEDVLEDLKRRDARDAGRTDAPMRAADDAQVIDTTQMTIDEVMDHVKALINPIKQANLG